jgi:hypothetical protein
MNVNSASGCMSSPTNAIEHSPSWEATSRWADEEIPRFMKKTQDHNCHINPHLNTVLNQNNLIHTLLFLGLIFILWRMDPFLGNARNTRTQQ